MLLKIHWMLIDNKVNKYKNISQIEGKLFKRLGQGHSRSKIQERSNYGKLKLDGLHRDASVSNI